MLTRHETATLNALLERIDITSPALSHDGAAYGALQLMRLSGRYARLQVIACNTELTDRQRARERKLEDDITALCDALGLELDLSGDPRGYVVKVDLGHQSNELGGWWGIA